MANKNPEVDYFNNGLILLGYGARSRLYDFSHFHAETEKAWEEKDKKIQDNLNDELQANHEFQHPDIVDSYAWDLHQNQYQFPNIHRESLVITIYNFLEAQLNELCDVISKSIDSKVKLKDLKGQGITRAFLYLTKVADFDFTAMAKEKAYIDKVNKLRNIIVHNAGHLPDKTEKSLNNFVNKNSYLSGELGNTVTLSNGFIHEYINVLIDFFDKLEKEIQVFSNKENA